MTVLCSPGLSSVKAGLEGGCGKLGGGTGGKKASLSLLLGVGWGGQCFSA